MNLITKPMLAAKRPVMESLFKNGEVYGATPKLDGIRCLRIRGQALSRTFKAIPNRHIRHRLEVEMPDGFDGELVSGTFNESQSNIMSFDGDPNFKYIIFDYIEQSLVQSYEDRMENLRSHVRTFGLPDFCEIVYPVEVRSIEELQAQIDLHLSQGYEGTMIRLMSSPYKCGRATLKEGYLTAIKLFVDEEAVVTGFIEQMTNTNEKTKDNFGNTERSSAKAGMIPNGKLGVFTCYSEKWGNIEVGGGEGMTHELRKHIWENHSLYLGKTITFRYQPHGVKDKPRILTWRGFRDLSDIGDVDQKLFDEEVADL